MGVRNLMTIIQKYTPNAITYKNINDYQNKIIGFDGNLLLYKTIYAIRHYNKEIKHGDIIITHIHSLYKKLLKLQELNIKSVFVFDGQQPDIKQKTLDKRTLELPKSEFQESLELIKLFNCPIIFAPQEADSQLVQLWKENKIDYIASDDMDILVFGGSILKNFTTNSKKKITEININEIYNSISKNQLLKIAILIGNDYNDRINGPISAYKRIMNNENISSVLKFSSPDANLVETKVYDYYMNPIVTKNMDITFKSPQHNKEKLQQFLVDHGYKNIKGGTQLVNPPLQIEKIAYEGKIFNLIQDTYLETGTKQRGIGYFQLLKDQGYDKVVTYASNMGYGQVAVSYMCHIVGLECILFIKKHEPRSKMTTQAMKYNKNIIEVGNNYVHITNTQLSEIANKYYLKHKNEKIKLIGLGLDSPDFINYLGQGIKEANTMGLNPKRIWVAGGSGVLARALHIAFPNAKLLIVQVGRKIWPDIVEGIDHIIYESKVPFTQKTDLIPPYKSLSHYDAKVWKFVTKYGENDDFIYNVK